MNELYTPYAQQALDGAEAVALLARWLGKEP